MASGDWECRFNCHDGADRRREVIVTVRDGKLMISTPPRETAVFGDPESLEQAAVVARVIALGVAQIRQQQRRAGDEPRRPQTAPTGPFHPGSGRR